MAFIGWLLAGPLNALADWFPADHAAPSWQGIWQRTVAPWQLPESFGGRWLRRTLLPASMAISAVGLAVLYGPTLKFLLVGLTFAVLVLITVIDLEHRLIFPVVVIPAALFGLLYSGLASGRDNPWLMALLGGLSYGLIMLVLYLGGFVFGRVWGALRGQPLDDVVFGLGDVYLGAAVGLLLGWPGVILGLLLTVFAGAAVGLAVLVVSRLQHDGDIYMPYGPYITLSAMALIVYAQWLNLSGG